MTFDELDALPEAGTLTFVEEIRDGRRVLVPHISNAKALFHGPNDIMLIEDRNGVAWTTGWAGGVLYKRIMLGWDRMPDMPSLSDWRDCFRGGGE